MSINNKYQGVNFDFASLYASTPMRGFTKIRAKIRKEKIKKIINYGNL